MPAYTHEPFGIPANVSRRLILLLIAAVGVALIIALMSPTPLVVDGITRVVDWIAKASWALIFVVALLILTIAVGAWATVSGIRAHGRRARASGRRKRLE